MLGFQTRLCYYYRQPGYFIMDCPIKIKVEGSQLMGQSSAGKSALQTSRWRGRGNKRSGIDTINKNIGTFIIFIFNAFMLTDSDSRITCLSV